MHFPCGHANGIGITVITAIPDEVFDGFNFSKSLKWLPSGKSLKISTFFGIFDNLYFKDLFFVILNISFFICDAELRISKVNISLAISSHAFL